MNDHHEKKDVGPIETKTLALLGEELDWLRQQLVESQGDLMSAHARLCDAIDERKARNDLGPLLIGMAVGIAVTLWLTGL